MKFHLVSLGCSKNLVDSERMLGRLMKTGWRMTSDPKQAHTIIINTCSFIKPAVDESVDTILELAKFKKKGVCRRLIVAGCLPERFREKIARSLPEVDIFLGTGAFDQIAAVAASSPNFSGCILPDPNLTPARAVVDQRVRSTPHMAYLKIAEGCNRACTYCIIPRLRGRQKSRPPEEVVSEARFLIASGAKELVLVAQETTAYGADLSPPADLSELLKRMSDLSGEIWVRVLYGHPESLNDSIIETIAKRPNLCSYFDVPVQHAAGRILKRMGRRYTTEALYRLFDEIRSFDPEAALRTTLLVGFPGETEKDFKEMVRFVDTVRFHHLGVFSYSDLDDLPSHHLPNHVPEAVAKKRHEEIMTRQNEISLKHNQKQIGRTDQVLVEGRSGDTLFLGRTRLQAPDVDGVTYIHSESLPIGSFANVRITKALEYDLIGEAICPI